MAKSKKTAALRQAYGQGNQMSAFRQITGCKQEWLAFQLGISTPYLAMTERGKRKMNKELRSRLSDYNAWALEAMKQVGDAQPMKLDAGTILALKGKILDLQLRLGDAEQKLKSLEMRYQEEQRSRETIAIMEKTKPEKINLRGKNQLQALLRYKEASAKSSNPEQQILARVLVAKLKAERDVLIDTIERFSGK